MKRYKDLMVAAKKEFNAYKNGDSTYNCGVFKEHENCHVKDCGCECHEKGKESAGANGEEGGKATLASRLGVKPRSSSTPAEPAPFQPFEEWLINARKEMATMPLSQVQCLSAMAAYSLARDKHHELCPNKQIDEKKLAEWLYEWDRKRLNTTLPHSIMLPAWAQSGWRNKQIYRNKAKEVIEYAKRK